MDIKRKVDVEKALIGCAIDSAEAALRVSSLPPELFSSKETRAAHAEICAMVSANEKIDLVSLSARLGGKISEPEAALISMQMLGIGPSMTGQYIALLYDAYKRRTLYNAALQAMTCANDPSKTISEIESILLAKRRAS